MDLHRHLLLFIILFLVALGAIILLSNGIDYVLYFLLTYLVLAHEGLLLFVKSCLDFKRVHLRIHVVVLQKKFVQVYIVLWFFVRILTLVIFTDFRLFIERLIDSSTE